MIRCLLVDDEPLAIQALRSMLAEEREVEVVGDSADGFEAIEKIRSLTPDLVFLDIQMPEIDGFEVVRRVAEHDLPVVVFVSAHDRFALRAFEVHALDYLLKPVAPGRLRECLARVRREIAQEDRDSAQALARLIEASTPTEARPLRRFAVRERDRYLLVREDEVAWFEASGNYVGLHARGKLYLMRGSLTDLAGRLDRDRFTRIHRSAIVNIDYVREIVPDGGGDFLVLLEGGAKLRLSRNYRDGLLPRG